MKDRLYINKHYRDTFLDDWDNKNVLGFHTVKAVDIFFIAVALGLSTPTDIQGAKDGYFQIHNNVYTKEKGLFGSILLGKEENKDSIDKYANIDVNFDEAERCAESGFLILKEKIDAAGGDEDLLEKRLIAELKLLYAKNVETNL